MCAHRLELSRYLRLISLACLSAWFFGCCDHARAADDTQESTKGLTSVYCGPRCVQRVLREYGIETDLVDLIREMQWPDDGRGASMQALADAIRKRGLHAETVNLESGVDIDWTGPAIVHVQNDGVPHYVVWLPPDKPDAAARVWDHDVSPVVLNPGRFHQARTGPLLLTSRGPIPDSAAIGHQVQERTQSATAILALIAAVVAFLTGWFAQRRFSGVTRDGNQTGNWGNFGPPNKQQDGDPTGTCSQGSGSP